MLLEYFNDVWGIFEGGRGRRNRFTGGYLNRFVNTLGIVNIISIKYYRLINIYKGIRVLLLQYRVRYSAFVLPMIFLLFFFFFT